MWQLDHGGMTSSHAPALPEPTTDVQASPAASASGMPLAFWTIVALLAVVLWDLIGADMAMARWAGDANGFALRHHWFFSGVAHDGAKRLSWALVLALCAAVWWPVGPLRQLTGSRRLQLALTPLIAGLSVTLFKAFSLTSCPWDLHEFGGVARYWSHWNFLPDGGSGRCFPGGHAAHGFAMLAGYFVFRHANPTLAKRWLWSALLAGLLLGLAQQWRGAHFMSHTLWAAWLCWLLLWAMDGIWPKFEAALKRRDNLNNKKLP